MRLYGRLAVAEGAGIVDRLLLEVRSKVDSGARNLPVLMAAVGKAATAATAAIAGVTLAAARYADVAAKTSDRLGIQVDEYAALAVAADLADVSVSALISSSQSYARQAEAAASGSKRQAEAFARLGIDAEEALNSNESFAAVLPRIIDGLQAIEQPALRAATAQQVLGRGARDLGPMIRGGSEALEASRRIVSEWGLSLTRDVTDPSEQLNDAISLLGARARGMAITFGLRVVPAALRLTEALAGMLDAARPRLMHLVERAAAGVATAIDMITTPAGSAAAAILGLATAFNVVVKAGGVSGLLGKIPVIGGALSGLTSAAWAAVAPWAPLALAIGAVVLVIDDLFAFMRGGDSIIGRFAKSLGVESELYTALSSAVDLFWALWDVVSAVTGQIPAMLSSFAASVSESLSGIIPGIEPVIDSFRWMLDNLPSLSGMLTSFSRGAQVAARAATVSAQQVRGERTGGESFDEMVMASRARLAEIDARRTVQQAQIAAAQQQTNNTTINVNGGDTAEVQRVVQRVMDRTIGAAAGQAR
jgi:hypothetical protein